jgi:GxxExxY protein
MGNLLYADLTYQIRGALFDVYNKLGPGHSEEAYQNALEIAFGARDIPCQCEENFDILYEGYLVGRYRPDLFPFRKIILELKAVPQLLPIHHAQTISYLRVTGVPLGLLANFGGPKLEIERKIYTKKDDPSQHLPPRGAPCPGIRDDILYPELSYALGNCGQWVHGTLGPGFLFHVYYRAMKIEMGLQGIPYEEVKYLDVTYDGQWVGRDRVHLLVADERILVVPAAVGNWRPSHNRKVLNWLRRLDLTLAMVFNFHKVKLDMRAVRV